MDLRILAQTILSFGSYFMNWFSLYRSIRNDSSYQIPEPNKLYNTYDWPSCKCNCQYNNGDLKYRSPGYPIPECVSIPTISPYDQNLPQKTSYKYDNIQEPEKNKTLFQTITENLLSAENIRTIGVPLALKAFEFYQKTQMDNMLKTKQNVQKDKDLVNELRSFYPDYKNDPIPTNDDVYETFRKTKGNINRFDFVDYPQKQTYVDHPEKPTEDQGSNESFDNSGDHPFDQIQSLSVDQTFDHTPDQTLDPNTNPTLDPNTDQTFNHAYDQTPDRHDISPLFKST